MTIGRAVQAEPITSIQPEEIVQRTGRNARRSVIPDAEESRHFWSDILDQAVTYRENTDWLRKIEN